jgi:catechol 2,3-dioxygenase
MTTDPLDVDDLVSAGAGETWDGAPVGTTLGHVHLHVGDLAQAAAFYHEVVGFDVTVSNYPGALFFAAGGYHHHLGTNTWAPGPAAAVDQARLLEWTLIVPSAAEARVIGERLLTAGHDAAANGHDWTVADPWGTPLRIAAAT